MFMAYLKHIQQGLEVALFPQNYLMKLVKELVKLDMNLEQQLEEPEGVVG